VNTERDGVFADYEFCDSAGGEPAKCIWCNATECDCEHRITCTEAGQVGHQQCGWCERCNAPRFQCSHLALMPKSVHMDMTPQELVEKLKFRSAWLMKHVKVGSFIMTTAQAHCIAMDLEAAAEMLERIAEGEKA
jgi:hypothetical protein